VRQIPIPNELKEEVEDKLRANLKLFKERKRQRQ
jgi:hypothetical protein